eukprot:3210700-Amphidinium_carterae.1
MRVRSHAQSETDARNRSRKRSKSSGCSSPNNLKWVPKRTGVTYFQGTSWSCNFTATGQVKGLSFYNPFSLAKQSSSILTLKVSSAQALCCPVRPKDGVT